ARPTTSGRRSHSSGANRAAIAVRPAASDAAIAAAAPPPGAGVRAGTASRHSFSPVSRKLEESDSSAVLVDVDVERRWIRPQPGHRLHRPAESDEPARTRV